MDLQRFVVAQDAPSGAHTTYERALAELADGAKRTHWMWFVFPQIEGLGSSPMAQRYAIADLAEARAYLDHPVLGPRLRACVAALAALEGKTAREIMGHPDDLKLRSSLTLFAKAAEDPTDFEAALDRCYGGEPDPRTLQRLGA